MRLRVIHAYVGLVAVAAVAALASQDWGAFFSLPPRVLVGVGFLTVLGLVSEGSAVRSTLARGTSTSSITFLPLLACVLLFGTTASVFFFAVTGGIAEFFIRRKGVLKAVFNASQYVLCTSVAGLMFELSGGAPVAVDAGQLPSAPFEPQLAAFGAFGATFLALNNGLVLLAISLSESRLGSSFSQLVRKHGSSFVHDLLISPLGILFAFLYFQAGALGLAVSLLPLLFVRHSYLAKYMLERANRDLLTALVKAIETRDPYTSGHSMRVQKLAERIGRLLGLSERRIDELSIAALLHDIGKIEVVYEGILRKPGALSEEERRIMESHVTRGVEILTSLSSFPASVIDAVRHHHESVDGSGYPAGLIGDQIPLYARVIKICDSIDAMLSDRPYRSALKPSEVREQLEIFRGSHFDEGIVEAVIRAHLIQEYVEERDLPPRSEPLPTPSTGVRGVRQMAVAP
jgi:putative nucleotidyltransferase with HDIG domain